MTKGMEEGRWKMKEKSERRGKTFGYCRGWEID
jgi:hypothetical protein